MRRLALALLAALLALAFVLGSANAKPTHPPCHGHNCVTTTTTPPTTTTDPPIPVSMIVVDSGQHITDYFGNVFEELTVTRPDAACLVIVYDVNDIGGQIIGGGGDGNSTYVNDQFAIFVGAELVAGNTYIATCTPETEFPHGAIYAESAPFTFSPP